MRPHHVTQIRATQIHRQTAKFFRLPSDRLPSLRSISVETIDGSFISRLITWLFYFRFSWLLITMASGQSASKKRKLDVTEQPEGENMAEDYGRLFYSNSRSDFTVISSDERKFPVHSVILEFRSAYFAGLFRIRGEESIAGSSVLLHNIDGDTLEPILEYIYSGRTVLGDTTAEKMLAAADFLGLLNLKEFAEEHLIAKVTVKNAADMVVLADRHASMSLKEKCCESIQKHTHEFLGLGEFQKVADYDLELADYVQTHGKMSRNPEQDMMLSVHFCASEKMRPRWEPSKI